VLYDSEEICLSGLDLNIGVTTVGAACSAVAQRIHNTLIASRKLLSVHQKIVRSTNELTVPNNISDIRVMTYKAS